MSQDFVLGDVVFWTSENFNPEFWNKLSLEDRRRYYSWTQDENGAAKPFVFITEINQAPGHCVLLCMKTGKLEWMRHTTELRLATEDEV